MIKRFVDIVVSFFGLLLLFPFLMFMAGLVKKKLGSPILFRQLRAGKNHKPFFMFKFRSMLDKTDKNGVLLTDEERLTPFGRKLRQSSIDELPGLWNVLKGEMSLVGPRPLLTDYVALYSKHQAKRHDVKPGITGWAQINGRNSISWEEKFNLDVWYVENQSFALDCKILYLTIAKVLAKADISPKKEEIMPRFTGSSKLSDHHDPE